MGPVKRAETAMTEAKERSLEWASGACQLGEKGDIAGDTVVGRSKCVEVGGSHVDVVSEDRRLRCRGAE